MRYFSFIIIFSAFKFIVCHLDAKNILTSSLIISYNNSSDNNNNSNNNSNTTTNNNLANNISPNERQALYDLYYSTNGNDWIYQEGNKGHWDFTDPNVNPCLPNNTWQGLNCTIITSTTTSLDSYYYVLAIRLSNYNLHGYIPYSIGSLNELKYLNLSYNHITYIQNNIYNLKNLLELDLSFNSIFGKLSNDIRNLTSLRILDFGVNQLTGTLPNGIAELYLITYVNLVYNDISGTIPSSLSNLTHLSVLNLSSNKLNGTIPHSLGDLSLLEFLNLGYNHLSGTIPSSLSKLRYLYHLHLGTNQLKGSLPHWIGDLSILTFLSLSLNQLSSTIPSSLCNLVLMKEIYLNNNILDGSIPNLFNVLSQLSIIEFNYNYFTGTLPNSISQLRFLNNLFLQNNYLSGNLDKVFNGSFQKQLNNIQLSNNQFTGTLPEQIFLSHSIVTFLAVENCFHGSIPSSICNNTNLVTLALDGLVCASTCRNKLIPSISNAYISDHKITGGIPTCLWSMPTLQVLHLSGNSLTGSLPNNVKLTDSLVDLSLSYNLLTGSIPSYIQERVWYNLDLSHNRISGILRSNYARQSDNASLSLKNNRLSGTIPNHLQIMRNISILEGNAYDCKYDRSDLPTHDAYKDTYECGSNTFNIMYYIWLGLIFILSISIFVVWYYRNEIDRFKQVSSMAIKIMKWVNVIEYIKVYYEIENIEKACQYFRAYNTIQEIIFSFYSTILIITILLPVYVILSTYYASHTYEYAWKISILYLSGKIAFEVIVSILILFIIIQVYIFYYSIRQSRCYQVLDVIEQRDRLKYNNKVISNQWKIYVMYLIYILINVIIVCGANIAYVYVVLYQSNKIIIICQFALSIFKMFWNTIVSPKLVNWIIKNQTIMKITNTVVQRRLFVLQFVVSLSNNIIIPCFVVAIVSPNCFYNIFHQESDVTSSFTYKACFINNLYYCIKYGTIQASSTTYSPPFIYSYQCSTDFITYYASVFVLVCVMSAYLIPLIHLVILQLSLRYRWIANHIRLNKIFYHMHLLADSSSPLLDMDVIYEFLVSILTMVGLLLTFGVVFPPLAVVFLLAIYRRIYYHKAILGRYISYAMECKTYSCLDMIDEDCKVIPLLSTIQLCGWILLYISCMFYTLFLFDILGDDVGVKKAYWVLIVIPCIPPFMHIVYKLCKYWFDSTRVKIDSKSTDNVVSPSKYCTDTIGNGSISSQSSIISNPMSTDCNESIFEDIYSENREGNSILIKDNTYEQMNE